MKSQILRIRNTCDYLRALVGVAILVLHAHPMAAADGITVEFMASRVSSFDGEFAGHAFLCVGLQLNNGIKEECYGFYPRSDRIKAYIGGPGVVVSEFQKKPNRFSRIDQSLKVPISIEQRRMILRLVNDWNAANYALSSQHCVDFIRSAAEAAGLKAPARRATELPVEFLARLKSAQ